MFLLGFRGSPRIVIKLWLENHIFTFLTSSLKQPAGDATYYPRRLPKFTSSWSVKIIVKCHLQAFWQNFEKRKMPKFRLCFQDLSKSLPQNYSTELEILHIDRRYSPWAHVIQVCSKIVVLPTLLAYNNQRQIEHSKFNGNF